MTSNRREKCRRQHTDPGQAFSISIVLQPQSRAADKPSLALQYALERITNGLSYRQPRTKGNGHRYMEKPMTNAPPLLAHGARQLSLVTVDAYNAELRHGEGFAGDRASKRAFQAILDDWRERIKETGEDPLGDAGSEELTKKKLDKVLTEGSPEAAGVVQAAIEEFSQEFTAVILRLIRLKDWKDTERIVVGGGLRGSRIGELVIGRTAVMLKADGCKIELQPIRHHPDEAGLIGAVHL